MELTGKTFEITTLDSDINTNPFLRFKIVEYNFKAERYEVLILKRIGQFPGLDSWYGDASSSFFVVGSNLDEYIRKCLKTKDKNIKYIFNNGLNASLSCLSLKHKLNKILEI